MDVNENTSSANRVEDIMRALWLDRKTRTWQRVILFLLGFWWLSHALTPKRAAPTISDHIAVVSVEGVLQSSEEPWYQSLLRVYKDPHAKALVMRMNSPGGVVHVADSAKHLLQRIHKRIPVVTVVDMQAASAAYLLASESDAIFAKNTSIVGSIGVVSSVVVVKELMEKFGIQYVPSERTQTITDIPFLGVTPFIKKHLYMAGEDSYAWFQAQVQQGRQLTENQLANVVDGRIFLGADAKEKGLIDSIGGMHDALDWLREHKQVFGVPLYDYAA